MDNYFYSLNNIGVRNTKEADLDFVLAAERDRANSPYVAQWSREQHVSALDDPDILHVIIADESDKSVGYAIIAGVLSETRSIELKRIVIVDKGKGLGRKALQLFIKMAFEKLKAHRLWLDVRENNDRARQLYRSAGFVEEGLIRDCLLIEDKFMSHYIMSILEHEYKG
ncbi:MAG: family N-acetyltransferase [Clostridia bacterium]|nr:family N-acetyltransferase [Clostridia bacterium]